MASRRITQTAVILLSVLLGNPVARAAAVTLVPLSEPRLWSVLECRLDGVPAFGNPLNPDELSVDATLTTPSGVTRLLPGFWYRPYSSRLVNGAEVLTATGSGEWRLRLTPTEFGRHQLAITVRTNGLPAGSGDDGEFQVPRVGADEAPRMAGFARVAANQRCLATDDGKPLPLVGHCVCWPHQGGTFDYRQWFAAMAAGGENYTRLWMAPWAFGIEAEANTRLNYRLDRAWQLDEVMRLAGESGIRILLCLDYHGMFETEPDSWGGNNNWPIHPYNAANGGPCATQAGFFTNSAAKRLYQHRLRYLVARYGAYPQLLAWQFFNEIDNVYRWLNPTQVAAWHADLGDWLKANDPWRHLVTTSLTGGSDRSEIWGLRQMDFSVYHSYGESSPVGKLSERVRSFLDRYHKPVLIGEFGTDWRGWRREQDPFLRGWRQGIWAGALSGSVGTAMSWWWEDIHAANLYPAYRNLRDFTTNTDWGSGGAPASFLDGGDPPATLGETLPDGVAFDAYLALDPTWGAKTRGTLALANSGSTAYAARFLNAFVHGTSHPDLRTPFRLEARLGSDAALTLHLNSVSAGAVLRVLVDGATVTNRSLPNKDGKWEVNGEYNEDFRVRLPSGRHTIEVRNAGADWFYLDWARLDRVLPSSYADGWQASPVATGVVGTRHTLVYVVNPSSSFPANATNAVVEPLRGGGLQIRDLSAGSYRARWFAPSTGQWVAETDGQSDGALLRLPLPDLTEDLAGLVERSDLMRLSQWQMLSAGQFQFSIFGSAGQVYAIQGSDDLSAWQPLRLLTNASGEAWFRDESLPRPTRQFFRARLSD